MSDEIPTNRREAFVQGSQFFFTGRPCRRGHVTNRYTSSGVCVECNKLNLRAHNAKLREEAKDRKQMREAIRAATSEEPNDDA